MKDEDDDTYKIVIDSIEKVKSGNLKGVVIYAAMAGCPYCERYNGTWNEACKKCPKGMMMIKMMMEDFRMNDPIVGEMPRSFPTIYSYVRDKENSVKRSDHSQERDRILDIVKTIDRTPTPYPRKSKSRSKTMKKSKSKSKSLKKSKTLKRHKRQRV